MSQFLITSMLQATIACRVFSSKDRVLEGGESIEGGGEG